MKTTQTVRKVLNSTLLAVAGFLIIYAWTIPTGHAVPLPGGTLNPLDIPKYSNQLIIPPVMPFAKRIGPAKFYEIEVVQFDQQILPSQDIYGNSLEPTTVWSYAAAGHPETRNYPAFTIENKPNVPTLVKWINNLVAPNGNFLPHLLPVDQTLHWANPPGPIDSRPQFETTPGPYTGPVPIITHVHGAHVGPESDGYPEAWYLPKANNIPAGFTTEGTFYDDIFGGSGKGEGFAVFKYPNNQRPTTLWYHDHALGITRLNVYAGLAGFYIIRDFFKDKLHRLPGPAPKHGDPLWIPNDPESDPPPFREIPIVIQDRSFNEDGSLFYPESRTFFDGFMGPFIPDSDVPPIWNPEAFFNTMVVNGKTWPVLAVEQRKYRFRFLNGCNSRFLILRMVTDNTPTDGIDDGDWAAQQGQFWQIGADGGFLPKPVNLNELLMAPAERADVIIDFSQFDAGTELFLVNVGPDEPFGGGVPGVAFDPADPSTTGQVMKFKVVPLQGRDRSRIPKRLSFIKPLFPHNVRQVSLNEEESSLPAFDGPIAALLGTVNFTPNPEGVPLLWADAITENPAFMSTEMWEIYNFTVDAHPIHLHLVQFQVVEREAIGGGPSIAGQNTPMPWETGFKDTVIAYPGEITRIRAKFDIKGLYVWHCHILEHEDNEMMRSYYVGNPDREFPVKLPFRRLIHWFEDRILNSPRLNGPVFYY